MIGKTLIRFGAAAARILLYRVCPRYALGPRAEFWDVLRSRSVGAANRLLGGVLHTDRPIRDEEFAGMLPMDPDEAERLLWERGFHRNPVAAVKTREGTPEIGSWVRRDHPTARRQLHVMLFQNPDEKAGVDVYAHEEFSCLNSTVAVRHYRGIDQRPGLGVAQARALLPLVAPPRESR